MENTFKQTVKETSGELLVKLIEILYENRETLKTGDEPTEEQAKALEEVMTDAGIKFINSAGETKMPWTNVDLVFMRLEDIVKTFSMFVTGTLDQWDNEAVSRMYGIKNADGKFRKEEITIGELAQLLEKSRVDSGNVKEDYYN